MDKLINDFSFGLFFWQLLILVVLILLLKRFAWKPILDALNNREEGINSALAAAENAKKEMANLKADNEKLLKEARAERETMLKEAREIKDKVIADAKEEAQQQADKMIKQAQETIEHEKQFALIQLKNQVASLAIEIAEKVIKEELSNEEKQRKIVSDRLDDVTTLN